MPSKIKSTMTEEQADAIHRIKKARKNKVVCQVEVEGIKTLLKSMKVAEISKTINRAETVVERVQKAKNFAHYQFLSRTASGYYKTNPHQRDEDMAKAGLVSAKVKAKKSTSKPSDKKDPAVSVSAFVITTTIVDHFVAELGKLTDKDRDTNNFLMRRGQEFEARLHHELMGRLGAILVALVVLEILVAAIVFAIFV